MAKGNEITKPLTKERKYEKVDKGGKYRITVRTYGEPSEAAIDTFRAIFTEAIRKIDGEAADKTASGGAA